CPITAACSTCRAGSAPAPVATALPSAIGPFATASDSIPAPPARLIAPATPAPIQRWAFAAFAIASTSSRAMSPSTISGSSLRPPEERKAEPQPREGAGGDARDRAREAESEDDVGDQEHRPGHPEREERHAGDRLPVRRPEQPLLVARAPADPVVD